VREFRAEYNTRFFHRHPFVGARRRVGCAARQRAITSADGKIHQTKQTEQYQSGRGGADVRAARY
jgi:hypothetical protein